MINSCLISELNLKCVSGCFLFLYFQNMDVKDVKYHSFGKFKLSAAFLINEYLFNTEIIIFTFVHCKKISGLL